MRSGSVTAVAGRQGILGERSRGNMLRRISTKLVVAVLTAVVLPFVAFAVFIDTQMAERLTRHLVQQGLLGLAKDLGRAARKREPELRDGRLRGP